MHCVIHREHLIAKNLDSNLFDSLDIIIKCINKIKRNSLHERIFKSLCEDYNEDYNKLLLHTAERWLSKGKCLIRFHKLYNTILIHMKEHDNVIYSKLIYIKKDLAYLADIFEKLNLLNKSLQGKEITCYTHFNEISE